MTKQKRSKLGQRLTTINTILKAMTQPMTTSEICEKTGYDKSRVSFNLKAISGNHTKKLGIYWHKLKDEFTVEDYKLMLDHTGGFPTQATISGARFITFEPQSKYEKQPNGLAKTHQEAIATYRKDRARVGCKSVAIGSSFGLYL